MGWGPDGYGMGPTWTSRLRRLSEHHRLQNRQATKQTQPRPRYPLLALSSSPFPEYQPQRQGFHHLHIRIIQFLGPSVSQRFRYIPHYFYFFRSNPAIQSNPIVLVVHIHSLIASTLLTRTGRPKTCHSPSHPSSKRSSRSCKEPKSSTRTSHRKAA